LPPRRDEELLHQLDPEQRLVAAVFRQALKDLDHRELPVQGDARAFLRGGGSFTFLCAVGHLEPARVAQLAATPK
jgi:hypothetical protein